MTQGRLGIDFRLRALELIERLTKADDIGVTRADLIEQALAQAYQSGLDRAASYVDAELSVPGSLSGEIRKLDSCF